MLNYEMEILLGIATGRYDIIPENKSPVGISIYN